MGLFSFLFGNSSSPAQNNNTLQQKHDTTIKFRPELVSKLINDHHAIFALYNDLLGLANNQEYSHVGEKVHEFKSMLQAHVIVENVQFYTYLETTLSDDPTNLEFIKDVRKEMNDIAHAVIKFSKKYQDAHFNTRLKQEFSDDLENIGAVLTQRVSMEESQLYTLYEE